MFGHGLAQFAPQLERILGAFVVYQLAVDLSLTRDLGSVAAVAFGGGQALCVCEGDGTGSESAKDATNERVGAEAIGAVVLIFTFTGRKDAGNICHLIEVNPEAAHGVVHAGEDLHGDVARVVADKLLV